MQTKLQWLLRVCWRIRGRLTAALAISSALVVGACESEDRCAAPRTTTCPSDDPNCLNPVPDLPSYCSKASSHGGSGNQAGSGSGGIDLGQGGSTPIPTGGASSGGATASAGSPSTAGAAPSGGATTGGASAGGGAGFPAGGSGVGGNSTGGAGGSGTAGGGTGGGGSGGNPGGGAADGGEAGAGGAGD